MLWVAFALMTGAAVLCALWPLSRPRSGPEGDARAIAFHKAQLAEIDRDVERGQLPPGEAAGARAEAARRLIAAGALSLEWLLIEWPEGEKTPTKYWFSTLPADTPIGRSRRHGQTALAHRA